jgi:hypothetical protein
MFHLVKVRVDVTKMAEFEKKFGPYRSYYQEIEIRQVVLPTEAQALILKKLGK